MHTLNTYLSFTHTVRQFSPTTHTLAHNRPTTISVGVQNSRGVYASGTQLCLPSKLATISEAPACISGGEREAFISSYGLLSCSPKY